MNSSNKLMSRGMRHILLTAVIAGVAAVAVAEQVVVKTEVNVKSDTNAFADPIETVGSDTQLEVLSHKDGWLRVRTPSGKEGFIAEGDLPSNQTLASVQGNGQTNGVSTDAAMRGLDEDAESYAKSKSWNTAGVEQMISMGKAITDNELIAFGQAGHVGPKKFRH